MKKIYIILIALFVCIIGCLFLIPKNIKQNQYMHTEIEQVYTYEQFDSLCISDKISNKLNDWDHTIFLNDSTIITQYMYLIQNNDTTIVYSVIPNDSTLFINKRISID